MKKFTPQVVLTCMMIILSIHLGIGQIYFSPEYEAAIQTSIQNGTFEGFQCGTDTKFSEGNLEKNIICTELSTGYGTNGWLPASNGGNADPACTVSNTTYPALNGGFYRIPLHIVIYECATWAGTNYLNGTGFAVLPDADINTKLTELNTFYVNSKIEYYEASRERIQDCDLYDYYRNNTDPVDAINDGVDDLGETAAEDIDNVINLYFVGGLDGDHDSGGTMGFAPYPNSREYSIMRYGAAVGGSTLAHELGHFFGVRHTHNASTSGGIPAGALDNSDCLAQGDGICDTWPDPKFSFDCMSNGACTGVDDYCFISDVSPRCDFDAVGYNCFTGTALTIDPNTGTDMTSTTSTVLKQNIMSYNFYSGCRVRFSPCQYYKMNQILKGNGCRDDLCWEDAESYFQSTTVNNANSPYQEICAGEAVPTLMPGKTITKFDGSTYSLNSFFFFTNQNDALASRLNPVATNSYTPSSIVMNNVPGTYEVWVAEANAFADPPCKVRCTIEVLADSGNGTPSSSALTGNTTINLSAPSSNMATGQVIGWWVTEDNPISSTVSNQATLDAALPVSAGGIVTNPANHIFASTANDIDYTLSMNCNSLDVGKNYYATPVVSLDDSGAPSYTHTVSTAIPDNTGANLTIPISVSGLTGAAVLTQVCVFISHPFVNDLVLSIQAPNGNQALLISEFLNTGDDFGTSGSLTCFFAPGSGGYNVATETTCNGGNPPCLTGNLDSEGSWANLSGVAPNGTWNFIANDIKNTGLSGTIESIELIFNPPPAGSSFPTIDYSSCVFGNPVAITCAALLPIELTQFSGRQQDAAIQLDWQTATETNNDYFILEKSIDGKSFQFLSKINGAGTSLEPLSYQDRDLYPVSGNNYYRLSQVDFDGTVTVSDVIVVRFKTDGQINIRPNPSKDGNFNFDFETLTEGNGLLEIYKIDGKKIYEEQVDYWAGQNTIGISLSNMDEGVFIIKWKTSTEMKSSRFLNLK